MDLMIDKRPAETVVCVAMSGGVDSTAAAILLKEQGYKVIGLTMKLLRPPYQPAAESVRDAGTAAAKLGIEHHYLDFREAFADKVVRYFTESYVRGLTPSPCLMCNRFIKLGLLADKARELGADVLVTGHYADVRVGRYGAELHRAKDLVRDQSYFLFGIEKRNLDMLRCPLAEMSKEETRRVVQEAGLEIYKKADSQDICFVNKGKYVELIQKLKPDYLLKKGDIVTAGGQVLGQHNGIINYTVGQRRGLGIGGGPIWYVLRIDAVKNQVIVGAHEELKQTKVMIGDVNWLGEEQPAEAEFEVKLRSRQNLVAAKVRFLPGKQAEVTLLGDFYGAAAGQGCCFYQGSRVMGGGMIL